MNKRDEFIHEFAEAIATMEGFYLDLSERSEESLDKAGIKHVNKVPVARAYNNPGNLMGKWGQYRADKNGYVIFPDPSIGWGALQLQISKNMARRLTFIEFFAGKPGVYYGYAPAGHGANKPEVYAHFVVNRLNKAFPNANIVADELIEAAADRL